VNIAAQLIFAREVSWLQDTAQSIVHPTLLKLPAYLTLQLVLLDTAIAVMVEMEAFPLCIGHLIQMPSMPTEHLVQAIEPRNRFMYARSVPAQVVVPEALNKVWLNLAPGVLINQILTIHFAFQFHRVLPDKNQHMVYVLLVPQVLSIARAERQQKPAAALARYPMQAQLRVFGIIQLSALLAHISTQILHQIVRIVLLVPLVMHVRVAPLLHRPVLLAKS